MRRRKLATLFILLVTPMVALFAANEAMAFSDEPCYGVNYTDSGCNPPSTPDVILEGQWQIKLVSVTPINGTEKYDWLYTVRNNYGAGNATGLNFFALLIPDCCTAPGVDVWVKNINSIWNDPLGIATGFKERFNVAAGEPTLKFGLYIENGYVVKGTPDASSDWHLVASTDQMTRSSGLIKTSSGTYSFEMVVPGCTPPPVLTEKPFILGVTECINSGQDTEDPTDDISFKVRRYADLKQCIESLWICPGKDCPESTCMLVEPTSVPDNYVHTGSFHPATCPDEALQITHGSPFWLYEVYSGSTYRAYCYHTGVPSGTPWQPCQLNCCSTSKFPTSGGYPACTVAKH